MSPYRPRRRPYTRHTPAPAEGCRSRRTTAGRRQTPGPGRRSFRRLRMSRCELADPIAEPRRRLIGAALAPHQAFHAGLEFEHLLTGRTVVAMRLHLAHLRIVQLPVHVTGKLLHRLLAVVTHQWAPTAIALGFGRPEYSHSFFCSAWRPRCSLDM